jgi:uncharacterized membrane protein
LLAAVALSASPASAHKDHKKKPAVAARIAPLAEPAAPGVTVSADPAVAHEQMGEMMEEMAKDRSKMSPFERLLDWLGRLHPMVVHFPIAVVPAALFTAIVGRRRAAFDAPVRFLVVAGGILAPIAALLGWFDAGLAVAADDGLLRPHRWLGTAIGLLAAGFALWAWRKPERVRGNAMIFGLAVITAAIIVQGWFGGAMVHGIDHMNW